MRVFVTGATGFIGQVVVKELKEHGYEVTGLARSDAAAKQLKSMGAKIHRGSLEDPESLTAGAKAADAVIHLAFSHDFTQYMESCLNDCTAIRALGEGLKGTDKPLLVTSYCVGIRSGGNEDDPATVGPRRTSEEAAMALVRKGVKCIIVRLPPSVHGMGDRGFIPIIAQHAMEAGVSAYEAEGMNCWNAVHVTDAAKAYRLIMEKGEAGQCFHVVEKEPVPFHLIAEAIGKARKLPCEPRMPDEVASLYGFFAGFVGMEHTVESELTRKRLGWIPSGNTLLQDLATPGYFDAIDEKSPPRTRSAHLSTNA